MRKSYIRNYQPVARHNAEKIAKRAESMKTVHAALAAQDLSSTEIAKQLGLNTSTVYGYLRQLEDEGYVCKTGQVDAGGRQTWVQDNATEKHANDHASRAWVVPARQLGMQRDPMIAALFGPAQGVAA